MSQNGLASQGPLGANYYLKPGQFGLPGHAGGGAPQHTATRKGCFDLWTAPVLATAPIMSRATATILRVFPSITFLLVRRKVSTFALGIHSPLLT